MPGPPPKRSEERRRRNKDGIETIKINLDETLAGDIEIPAPPMKRAMRYNEETDKDEPAFDEETGEELWEDAWHPTAVDWYLSFAKSGQAIFMEPSDWMLAYITAEQLHLNLKARPVQTGTDDEGKPHYTYMQVPMPGATLGAILKVHGSELMGSEGARRKLRIELDRKKRQDEAMSGDGKVVSISQNRQGRFKKEAQK